MNTRVRTTLQTMKTPMKHEKAAKSRFGGDKKEKGEKQGKGLIDVEKASKWRSSSKERKMALQQDVDKLKKKLRHEENLHRALERAFTRPLGALPRLPPYLPPNTLELLAEVAVLEEEVVRLEEQVVNFRQGLYEEAIHISASKKNIENDVDLQDSCQNLKPDQSKSSSCVMGLETFTERSLPFYPDDPSGSNLLHSNLPTDPTAHSSNRPMNRKQTSKRFLTPSDFTGDGQGKENQSNANFAKDKQIPLKKSTRSPASVKTHVEPRSTGKCLEPRKLQPESRVDQERAEDSTTSIPNGLESAGDNPNKISEDILRCLLGILLRMSKPKATTMESEILTSISGSSSSYESLEEIEFWDPYEICTELGKRDDIGPYKYLHVISASSIICDRVKNSPFLFQRLKILFGKLALVDLRGLSHQQKLAFWINIYNSCMMNAYLEQGIPRSPEMVIVLMRKAMINVSGHLLNAMTIEHFILRLPYSKFTPKGAKIDEATMRNVPGLDWPEPLVTFALSCGSWSSPAVRVYTASNVENELEKAKRDYLQAAVGISETKVAIPKLLDWYLLDFAKDLDSLLDWISVQIPGGVRKEAMKWLERGRKEANLCSVHVLPYEFSFRYLF